MFITKGPLSNRPFIVSSNVSINYMVSVVNVIMILVSHLLTTRKLIVFNVIKNNFAVS